MVALRIAERFFDALPALFTGGILFSCVWMLMNAPSILAIVTLLWAWYWVARVLFGVYAHARGLAYIKQALAQDWCEQYTMFASQHPDALAWGQVYHVVLLPNDHEPMRVLQTSIAQLATCAEASHMLLVLAMEAREADSSQKAEALRAEFGRCFDDILITYHPDGQTDEIPCKSANIHYAIKQAYAYLIQNQRINPNHVVVTAMDADTLWHSQYFSALTYAFITDEQRYHTFWQAPIRYHGKIEMLHPALQLVNIYASALELSYLSSWWMSLPISSYSVSLRLLSAHDYWDRDVIAEEWRIFLKIYFGEGGNIRVSPIFLPFVATVVHGHSFWEALKNRYFQTVRHALGSKEIGYTVARAISHTHIPLHRRMRLVGRVSHDIISAGVGWCVLLLGGQTIMLLYGIEGYGSNWGLFFAIQFAFLCLSLLAIAFWWMDNKIRHVQLLKQGWQTIIQTLGAFLVFPVLILFLLVLPTLHAQIRLLLGLPLKFRVSPKIG